MHATIILLIAYTLLFSMDTDTSMCEGIHDAIAVLVHHRKQIQEKIYYRAIPTTVFDAQKESMNKLSRVIDTLISGEKGHDYKKFVCTFLNYREEFSMSMYDTPVLSDTISIQFLSNLLRCDDEGMVITVQQYLYRETGFAALKSQSTYIKRNIRRSPLPYYCTTLLSLLNLTKEEKDPLLRIKLPLNIKANTGDTTALDSMVALYKKETDLSSKGRLIESIMSTGQQRGLITVLVDFPKPIYSIDYENTPYACTTSIIKNIVISVAGLRRYYPEDSLFTKEYGRIYGSDFRSAEGKELLIKFWNKLDVWFWKHYKIQIEKKPPHRNMFRGCYNSAFRLPPEYRKKR
jgi:hypothetical protein